MDEAGRSDEQLLKAFLAGETGALGVLAARYEQQLLGLALGLLRGRADAAQDAVQESWVRVIRYGKSFRGNSSVKTWLYRITINRCRDLMAERDWTAGGAGAAGAVEAMGGSASEAWLEEAESRRVLRERVAALGPAKSLVILLCYQQGMTHEQAAEILDVPLGTLKSRLSAALGELRQTLPQECRP